MIRLHEGQSEPYEDLFINQSCRFSTVNCARGWGKSYFLATCAATAVFELLELPFNVPNKRVGIVAPTYDQVTDIYFPLLAYEMGLEKYALSSSRDKGRFYFSNDTELRLLSYEAVERMRGKGYYMIGWDEVSSCTKGIDPKEAWQGIMQPCIVTRWSQEAALRYGAKSPGRGVIASTPKGYNYFHELCHNHEQDDRWKYYHYDYTGSPFLDPEEIEKLRHQLDPITFASEYLASFEESGNNVFYCFDRKIHVRNDIEPFQPGEDVHCCIDFNVGIQATSFFAIRGKQKHFIDEFKGHPDTEELAMAIKKKYAGHKIYAYPDPTGRSRKSSAPVGRTDFTILESNGIICLARSKSPPLIDSVAAVNKSLKTAAGDVNIFFHPNAKHTITSMERTKWVDRNPDTATIDKSEGIEHFSDGVRYAIEFLDPIRSSKSPTSRGFGF